MTGSAWIVRGCGVWVLGVAIAMASGLGALGEAVRPGIWLRLGNLALDGVLVLMGLVVLLLAGAASLMIVAPAETWERRKK